MTYRTTSETDLQPGMARDGMNRYQFADQHTIICVSLELPDKWAVSLRLCEMSQAETVSPFKTLGKPRWPGLRLRFGGWKVPGGHGIQETVDLMRTVAEWLVGGVAAPAEAYGRPACQAKGLPLGVDHFEITLHADGPVVLDCDFRRRHFFS